MQAEVLSLFDGSEDPGAALMAAVRKAAGSSPLRVAVLRALAIAGETGLTDAELGAHVGEVRARNVGTRRSELVRLGLTERTRTWRGGQVVWRVTERGMATALDLAR